MTRGCVLVFAAALSACAGQLEDPERFTIASSDEPAVCTVDPYTDVIVPRCVVCHGGDGTASASLDLESDDFGARLVGASSSCGALPLVDPADPSESYIVLKVAEARPECGRRMPALGRALSAGEIACVRNWAVELAGEAP